MSDPIRFSDRLKLARELIGLSQRELDRLAGLTERHGAVIEHRGTESPHPKTVNGYSRVLGCSRSWLAFGEGNPPTADEVTASVAQARLELRESVT